MKVFALGLSADLLERLRKYFYDLDIEPVDTLEVIECIPSLLLIDQVALGDDPLGYLGELRKRETPLHAVPIIYCLPPDEYDQAGLATRLVRRLGVKRVLATPVDLPELARSVAAELGIRMRPQPPRVPAARSQTLSALAGLWLKFRASNLARVHSLEMAAEVLQHGELEANARRQVEREMHKLVGSAGTFGFQEASLLAREAESLLAHASVLSGEQRLRLLELAQRIRFQLEGTAPPGPEAASKTQPGKSILVVSDDPEMAKSLPGFTLTRATSNEEARTLVRDQLPGALLLDACSGDLATRVQLLKELSWEFPQLPMLVLTGEQGLHARLALTEMGSVEVLCRPFTPQQISEELRILLERRGQLGVRVLAVDDDPSILEAVKGTLEPMGLAVETLSDPTLFWEALELSSPDLILLDVDMPYLSGLDLCRVLRTDPRWSDRPVLFLTAYFDTSTVQRIYQAGADDYIQKPVVDSELVTRISNRLARTQHYRRLADTDLLTGVATRRRGLRDLTRLLQIAIRHGAPLAVAMVDLDHFKQVNDHYGHGSGDLALRLCARHLTNTFRGEDTVIRWGGEEFVVGLFDSDGANAIRRLEQCLEALKIQELPAPEGGSFTLSFSAGVAQFPDDAQDIEGLLRLADQALYRAKQEGRSRVYGALAEASHRTVDVVLVEDDEALGELVLKACRSRGLSTHWFVDGAAAAAMLAEDPLQLQARVLLLDQLVPGMTGTELLARLREKGALNRTRVLLMTAQLEEGQIEAALEGGAFDFVSKPFALSALMRRIEFALGRRYK